jgi:hypothetical protein
MALSREEILALRPPIEAVDLATGKVFIKGLSARERDDYEQTLVETAPNGQTRVKRKQTNVRASLVVRCIVDESGDRMFADKDTDALGNVAGDVIDTLWDVARRLSGMTVTEAEVEGFDTAQDGDSSSASP